MATFASYFSTQWFTVFRCLLFNALTSGFITSSGVSLVLIHETFGVSRREASIPIATGNICHFFCSILSGTLLNIFAVRKALIISVTLGVLGSFLAFFKPLSAELLWISMCMGIKSAGLTHVFPIILQHLTNDSDEHRAKMYFLLLSGYSLSAVLFPLILEATASFYGLRGAWLIECGFYLQTFVLISAFKSKRGSESEPNASPLKQARATESNGGLDEKLSLTNDQPFAEQQSSLSKKDSTNATSSSKHHRKNNFEIGDFYSEEQIPLSTSNISKRESDLSPNGVHNNIDLCYHPEPMKEQESVLRPDSRTYSELNPLKEHLTEIWKVVKSPIFHIILLLNTSLMATYIIFYTIVVDMSRDRQIGKTVSLAIISLMYAVEFVGYFFGTVVIEKMFIPKVRFAWISYLSISLWLVAASLTRGYAFVAMTVFIGFSLGVISILIKIMIPVLGNKNIAFVYGSTNAVSGIIIIVLPFFIGYFRDQLGDYKYITFILAGFNILAATVIALYDFAKSKENILCNV